MEETSTSMILECEDGVRLKGSFSQHPNEKALIILLHGWEGSEQSTYVVSCGRHLYDQGASVFRLNYRDHGDSHALNAVSYTHLTLPTTPYV